MTKRFYSGLRDQGTKKYSASDMFMSAMKRGEKMPDLSPQERYQKAFKDKMDAMKNDLMRGSKFTFTPPGAAPVEKKISKTVELWMQKQAEKKARAEQKKAERQVKVQPKYFTGMQGGRIDAKGKIYDKNNKCILKVDLNTGRILNNDGICVGKYNPNSTFCEYKITRLIAKYSKEKRGGGNLLWQNANGHASANWGSTTPASNSSPGLQGGWGGGTSGFWGGGDKKDDAGWW